MSDETKTSDLSIEKLLFDEDLDEEMFKTHLMEFLYGKEKLSAVANGDGEFNSFHRIVEKEDYSQLGLLCQHAPDIFISNFSGMVYHTNGNYVAYHTEEPILHLMDRFSLHSKTGKFLDILLTHFNRYIPQKSLFGITSRCLKAHQWDIFRIFLKHSKKDAQITSVNFGSNHVGINYRGIKEFGGYLDEGEQFDLYREYLRLKIPDAAHIAYAARYGHTNMVSHLLDVNSIDENSAIEALSWSVWSIDPTTTELLLQHHNSKKILSNADIVSQELNNLFYSHEELSELNHEDSPIRDAAEVTLLLLGRGADPTKIFNGKSSIERCRVDSLIEVMKNYQGSRTKRA